LFLNQRHFFNFTFFITGVKNVSIYEFSRPDFTTQNVRKYRKVISPRPYLLSSTFGDLQFDIRFSMRILSSAFLHPPSAKFESLRLPDMRERSKQSRGESKKGDVSLRRKLTNLLFTYADKSSKINIFRTP